MAERAVASKEAVAVEKVKLRKAVEQKTQKRRCGSKKGAHRVRYDRGYHSEHRWQDERSVDRHKMVQLAERCRRVEIK